MSKYVMPPRQKMINLLYVILIAMLAINISSDVLQGYDLVDKRLMERIAATEEYIDTMRVQVAMRHDEQLIAVSEQAYARTQSMRLMLDSLREAIAQYADKDDYCRGKLHARDDLNATPGVMLSATNGKGKALRLALDAYRESMLQLIADSTKRVYVSSFLNLQSSVRGMSWERETFSYLPAIGGVMMLNCIEEEVVQMLAEVHHSLLEDGLAGVRSGVGSYVLINEGQRIVDDNGMFDVPVVLVSPSVINTLYAGYGNVLNIFCAGVPFDQLDFSASGGTVVRRGGTCIITPQGNVRALSLRIYCVRDGKRTHLCDYDYKVQPLPDPVAFLTYRGSDNAVRNYYGGVPIRREDLSNAVGVEARVNEGPSVKFIVKSFETMMIKNGSGEISSARSQGNKLSAAQHEQILKLSPGDKFYITSIVVASPDGTTKQISPINMIII